MNETESRIPPREFAPSRSRDGSEPAMEEGRLTQALEEYRSLLEAGRKPDRQEFLARYPEIAEALSECLAGLDFVHAAAANLSQETPGRPPAALSQEVLPPEHPLGDFRIIREVGKGGMGIVYEAEQLSLRRRVALKVLPFAATMDPRHLQRFHNEAQAAACLHHTNIVPVFFVGCERGVHFYAMQFIDGQPLSEVIQQLRASEKKTSRAKQTEQTIAYQPSPGEAASTPVPAADLTPLTGEGRLGRDYFRKVAELGVQAAEALDHAHQLGIVHRDIKPGNLLVDSAGRLWVTDFGLAQVRQGEAGLTMPGEMVGTLRYMSPEQALAKRVPIDHRTDVYSLGATLYELLTLRPAFRGEDRQELLRKIAFEDPARPRRLELAIPAELEIIVLKAMEKRPQDRYATAQELADDLERWLKHEPIHARRPSWVQVARKWVRRHQGLVAAMFVILAIAAFALSVSTLLIWREKEQTRTAFARAEDKSRLARQAVDEMYLQVAEKWLADQVQLTEVEQEFLRKALQFYEQFAREQGDEPEVRWDTARAYDRVARIQQKLGRTAEAERAFGQELALLEQLGADFPGDLRYRAQQAAVHYMLGTLHGEQLQAAEKAFHRALSIREKLVAEFPAEPAYRQGLAESYDALGDLLTDPFRAPGRYDEAEQFLGQAVNLQKGLVADYPTAPEYQMALAHSFQSLGLLLERRGRVRDSEQSYRQGIECLKAVPANSSTGATYRRRLASLLNNLGNSLDRTGQIPEAQEVGARAVEEYKRLVTEFPTTPEYRSSLGIALNNQGNRLREQQPEEACRLLEQACAEQRAACRANPRGRMYGGRLRNHSAILADTLLQLGKHDRAAQVVGELARTFPEDITTLAIGGNCLAHCALLAEKDSQLAEAARKALAQQYATRAKQMFGEALKWTEDGSAEGLNRLAWFLVTCPVAELRDPAGAVACARKAIGLRPKAGDHWNTLGVALYRARNWKEAAAALQKSMELRKGGDSNDWFFLAMTYWQLGDKEQAHKWYAQAVQWMDKNQPQDDDLRHFRAEAGALLGIKDPSTTKGKEVSPKKE